MYNVTQFISDFSNIMIRHTVICELVDKESGYPRAVLPRHEFGTDVTIRGSLGERQALRW